MNQELRVELADGHVIGYAETGPRDGVPVFYLHGTPSSRLEIGLGIEPAANRLGARVIAPDRPGIGLSPFRPYSVASYPSVVASFADTLGIDTFSIIAVSGGGRYGYACAWNTPERVDRLVTVASTCSFDVPGAKSTWSKQDRQAYTMADRAPWLFRILLANVKRRLQRGDLSALLAMFPEPGERDREALEHEPVLETLLAVFMESLRQGTKGAAHDYRLEARPWHVPLNDIRVPVEIWHGEDDRVVSPEQGKRLLDAVRTADGRFVPGEGHISLRVNRVDDILASAVAR